MSNSTRPRKDFPASVILSIHIPKTAGTSFRRVLRLAFGRDLLLHYWALEDADGRAVTVISDRIRCIHGHFVPDRFLLQFPEAALITWVRDPVERIASAYAHVLRSPDWRHPVHRAVHERKLSLLQFAGLDAMRNEMAHYLAGRPAAEFVFIGITERFDESLQRFFRRFGILPVGAGPRENCNPNRTGDRYVTDPEVRRKLAALNARDMDLYADCLHVFAERRSLVA